MKTNLFFEIWNALVIIPFLLFGIIFITFLLCTIYAQPNLVEIAEDVCGEVNMEHFNWKQHH